MRRAWESSTLQRIDLYKNMFVPIYTTSKMSVTGQQAKQAFASLNATNYVSRIPYATDVCISCLPSVNQADWRKTGLYCPEAFMVCSNSLVPNMAQESVITYKGKPKFVTSELTTELQLVYNKSKDLYTMAQQTVSISIQSLTYPSVQVFSDSAVDVKVSSVKAQSKLSNGSTQYAAVLSFGDQSFPNAEATQVLCYLRAG